MILKKILSLGLMLALINLHSKAQTQFSGWLASFNTVKFSKSFSAHLDVQLRSTDQVKAMSTFIFRPGINWHFRKNMVATAGYGYVLNRSMSSGITDYLPEHRIWEQFIINHPIGPVSVIHRFRLEQRFIPKLAVHGNELKANGHVFASRIRYFNRGILPLNGKKGFAKGAFAALQNEVFLNLGNKSSVNGKTFDQNRLYLAMGYRFSKKFDLEAGYLNQYVSGRNRAIRNNHVVQIASYLRL